MKIMARILSIVLGWLRSFLLYFTLCEEAVFVSCRGDFGEEKKAARPEKICGKVFLKIS